MRRVFVFAAMWSLAALVGCGGGEARKGEYLSSAQKYYEEGNIEKATVDVRNALQIDNEYLDARFLYAKIHESQQNWRELVANVRFILDIDPKYHDARILYATVLLASGELDLATKEVDQVIGDSPEHAEAHALAGAIAFRQGDNERAIDAAERSLGLVPGNVSAVAVLSEVYKADDPQLALDVIERGIAAQGQDALFGMMRVSVYEQTNELERAYGVYDELLAADPDNLYLYYRYISLLEENNNHDRSLSLLSEIVESKPDDVSLKLWLVNYLVNHRDVDQARTTLEQFVDQYPDEPDLVLGLGELYLIQRNFDSARAHYEQVIDQGGRSEMSQKARYALARLEAGLGNEEEANGLLADILEIEPENPDALLELARQAYMDGDSEEAVSRARIVLRERPSSVAALELLADSHIRSGFDDLAKDNLRQLLNVEPQHVNALKTLARLEVRSGNVQIARELAETAVRLASDDIDAMRLLVAAYAEEGEIQRALEQATAVGELEGGEATSLFLLGRIHQIDQQHERAVVMLTKVVELEPKSVVALEGLVQSYLAMGQASAAESFLLDHRTEHGSDGFISALLGTVQAAQEDSAGAIGHFQEAVEQRPELIGSHIAIGDLYVREDKLEQAVEAYQNGLRNNSSSPELRVRLGQMSELSQDYDEAILHYEKAIELNQENIIARNNLAVLYSEHRATPENLEKAAALVRRFANSKEPPLLDTLGWVHYRLGDTSQAIQFLEAAVELGTDDPTILFHLGMAYIDGERGQKGREMLEQALANANNEAWIDIAQAQLERI